MNAIKNKKRLMIIALAVVIVAVAAVIVLYKLNNVTIVWDGSNLDMSNIGENVKIHLIIPEDMGVAGEFRENDQIVSVKFEADDSVELDAYAFWKCTALKTVSFSKNATVGLRRGTFAHCTSLKSIDIPYLARAEIGIDAFYGCSSLESVTFDVWDYPELKIDGSAFKNCSSLKKVEVPSCEQLWINDDAFYGCGSLREVDFSSCERSHIGSNVFYECVSLKKVLLPSSYYYIDTGTFYGCSALEEVIYPDGAPVLQIHTSAFENCTSLKRFDIPEGSMINAHAFSECELIDIEDGVKYINKTCAIGVEDGVTRLTFREGTTSIAAFAFSSSSVEYVEIPSSITYIGSSAFSSSELKEVVYKANCDVPLYCFMSCHSLEKVDMSGAKTSRIGMEAFMYCRSLREVILPECLETIARGAFLECSALEEISFDKCYHLSEILDSAFSDCVSLQKVDLGDTSSSLAYVCRYVFKGCTSLKEVILPCELLEICGYAFSGYTSLETVTLLNYTFTTAHNNNCRLIDDYAFENCSSLKKIYNLRKDASIEEKAFVGCDQLELWAMSSI